MGRESGVVYYQGTPLSYDHRWDIRRYSALKNIHDTIYDFNEICDCLHILKQDESRLNIAFVWIPGGSEDEGSLYRICMLPSNRSDIEYNFIKEFHAICPITVGIHVHRAHDTYPRRINEQLNKE